MEPTKNPINNTNSNMSQSDQFGNTPDPIFQGMPKPGQPLASTPKFSAHAPSALDRIMNPNITNTPASPVPTPPVAPTFTPASSFKPYTSPAPTASPSPSSFSAPASSTAESTPSTSMGSVNIPTSKSTPSSNASAIPKSPSLSSSSPFGSSYPTAPASMTAKIDTVMGNMGNQTTVIAKHKNTLAIVSSIIVLLLLAGGGYYWYMTNSASSEDAMQTSGLETKNTRNTTQSNSSFPTGITRSVATSSSPVSSSRPNTQTNATKPVTTKPTRVTTPFTQTQRAIVSSYISANINNFATPKSSKGYHVTDVTFDGPDRALVEYTDSKGSYTALVVASIDTADNVKIVSFSHLDK